MDKAVWLAILVGIGFVLGYATGEQAAIIDNKCEVQQ